MRLQVDNEFQQVKLKDLNDQNNAETFTSSVPEEQRLLLNRKLENLKQEFQN